MTTNDTKKAVKGGLVLDGLKAVGDAAGVKASRPKIKKEMEVGVSIVNQLLEMLFTKRGNNNKREVELTALGLMAFYNVYRGVRERKKSSLVKGVFLSATLVASLVAYAKLHNQQARYKKLAMR
ncbi:hypothetical protein [Pedobacter endophyticus]|uniref:Uncharacterized protein n=1 Tax=Pedobacter endophyticus TaxID=2789740 RepID=A0A7S9PZY7_9SPHI|nr:hypothetical protein [Pedobacter endophyticus]QPH40191.1 hypothetical protein IZT61_02610 [Pedobacter endophyticus]